jgi:putative endonuclease
MWQLLYRLSDRARQWAQARRLSPEMAAGRKGEDLAHRYLRRKGYRIVARNFRARSGVGEIDLIARDGDYTVIVEVKSRQQDDYGAPERNIGPAKEQSLIRAARDYARRSGTDWMLVRFDVVSVLLRDPVQITHWEDAFGSPRPAPDR